MSTPAKEGGNSTRLRSSSSPPPVAWMESFNDDLLVEILSRVPSKSLCRFKCVSNHWLGLIDHPDHRKKLPQPLAGFVFTTSATRDSEWLPGSSFRFTSLWGRCRALKDTSFAFLPNHRGVNLVDCCRGLLLSRWCAARGYECRYIVCNPVTEEWVMLPEPSKVDEENTVRLGFDPAVSSHFYVFMLLPESSNDLCLTRVDVYSSETGRWARKEKRWNENFWLVTPQRQPSVFLNGCMHFQACGSKSLLCLVAVDTEGTWTIFPAPSDLYDAFLHQSHGCLHYSSFQWEYGDVHRLVVYILKDYHSKVWTLKPSVEASHISGGTRRIGHRWMAIHPECDLIFFNAGRDAGIMSEFMCYNMDRRQAKVVSRLEYGDRPYLPYVPFYAALQSLHL